MSLRARRPRGQIRRHAATPYAAHAEPVRLAPVVPPKSGVGDTSPPEDAAAALTAEDWPRAYSEAPQGQASDPPVAARWSGMSRIVARLTGRRIGLDTATRVAMDADFAADGAAPTCRPRRHFPEIDQVGELERILAAMPQSFRLQFVGASADRGPLILSEQELRAADATSAIRAAANADLPPNAIGLRIVDPDGREIFERLRADR